MTGCAVSACSNHYKKTKHLTGKEAVSYYEFPKDLALQKLWVLSCKRKGSWNPSSARVCSVHFKDEDFERNFRAELVGSRLKKILKKGSIPSLLLNKGDKKPVETARTKRLRKKERKQLVESLLENYLQSETNSKNPQTSLNINVPKAEPAEELRLSFIRKEVKINTSFLPTPCLSQIPQFFHPKSLAPIPEPVASSTSEPEKFPKAQPLNSLGNQIEESSVSQYLNFKITLPSIPKGLGPVNDLEASNSKSNKVLLSPEPSTISDTELKSTDILPLTSKEPVPASSSQNNIKIKTLKSLNSNSDNLSKPSEPLDNSKTNLHLPLENLETNCKVIKSGKPLNSLPEKLSLNSVGCLNGLGKSFKLIPVGKLSPEALSLVRSPLYIKNESDSTGISNLAPNQNCHVGPKVSPQTASHALSPPSESNPTLGKDSEALSISQPKSPEPNLAPTLNVQVAPLSELQQLKLKYSRLSEEFFKFEQESSKTTKKLRTEISLLKRDFNKNVMRRATGLFGHIFTPAQIKVIVKRKCRAKDWRREDLCRALALRRISRQAYLYIRNTMKIPLPAPSTLNRWIGKGCFPVEPVPSTPSLQSSDSSDGESVQDHHNFEYLEDD